MWSRTKDVELMQGMGWTPRFEVPVAEEDVGSVLTAFRNELILLGGATDESIYDLPKFTAERVALSYLAIAPRNRA